MPLTLKTPEDVATALRDRFKARRLAMNLTQPGLAQRAGINVWSLKRFEKTGLVALDSLLRISLVLGVLDDFDTVAADDGKPPEARSLDTILASRRARNRGRLK